MTVRLRLPGTAFTVGGLRAGAGDALHRLALAHDVVTTATEAEFLLPEYRNYHAPDLDFLELLGLRRAHANPRAAALSALPEAPVTLPELVRRLVEAPDGLRGGCKYVIDVRGDNRIVDLSAFRARFGLRRSFFARACYTPSRQVFAPRPACPTAADRPEPPARTRVVVHLRRNDICGKVLFGENDADAVPAARRAGIQNHDLLTLSTAVGVLESLLAPGTGVDLVIASDGLGRLEQRFRDYPAVVARVRCLQAELDATPQSRNLDLALVTRLIGLDRTVTRWTLDAMHQADLVLTSRPAFPRLIACAGGGRVVTVRPDGSICN